jgi:uncharacterized cupredoxin-like copper-binding protein
MIPLAKEGMMPHRRILASPAVLLLAILAAGCAPKPVPISVTLQDFSITMSQTTVPVNAPLVFTITNDGAVVHEVILEARGGQDVPFELNDTVSEVEDIEPGETVTLEWTLKEAGDYELACFEPGHYEQGMVMYFTVEP